MINFVAISSHRNYHIYIVKLFVLVAGSYCADEWLRSFITVNTRASCWKDENETSQGQDYNDKRILFHFNAGISILFIHYFNEDTIRITVVLKVV